MKSLQSPYLNKNKASSLLFCSPGSSSSSSTWTVKHRCKNRGENKVQEEWEMIQKGTSRDEEGGGSNSKEMTRGLRLDHEGEVMEGGTSCFKVKV